MVMHAPNIQIVRVIILLYHIIRPGSSPVAYQIYLSGVCVLLRGKRGAVCGKRLTCLHTSPYEHAEYNV